MSALCAALVTSTTTSGTSSIGVLVTSAACATVITETSRKPAARNERRAWVARTAPAASPSWIDRDVAVGVAERPGQLHAERRRGRRACARSPPPP